MAAERVWWRLVTSWLMFGAGYGRGRRTCPEAVRIFWVTNGDVPAHAFGIPFSGEYAEGEGHVLEHPLAVGGEGRVPSGVYQRRPSCTEPLKSSKNDSLVGVIIISQMVEMIIDGMNRTFGIPGRLTPWDIISSGLFFLGCTSCPFFTNDFAVTGF